MTSKQFDALAPWRRGASAVEFAIILPLLLMSTISVIELGTFLRQRREVVQATYETARYAAASPIRPSEVQVHAYANQVLESRGVDPSGLEVQIESAVDGGDPVITVGLSLPVRVLAGNLALGALHEQRFTLLERREKT